MEEHEIDTYVQTLHPQLALVHQICKSVQHSTKGTLGDNFTISAEIESIFAKYANWEADKKK